MNIKLLIVSILISISAKAFAQIDLNTQYLSCAATFIYMSQALAKTNPTESDNYRRAGIRFIDAARTRQGQAYAQERLNSEIEKVKVVLKQTNAAPSIDKKVDECINLKIKNNL